MKFATDFISEKIFYSGQTLSVYDCGFGVKHLRLNKPEGHNAFDDQMIREISKALSELAAIRFENDMRLLLLSGAGKNFCAGADLNYMRRQSAETRLQNEHDARELGQMFFKLASFPTPVVCAVRGGAIGGGLGLTVCSDMVVAHENAVFATSEVLLGIVPGVISPYIIRKLGVAHAAPFMLTGTRMKTEEALRVGLANISANENDFATCVESTVVKFLQAGPNAARRTKALVKKASPLPQTELFQFTCQAIADARASDEGKAGLAAFFNKTQPPWQQE